MERVVKLSVGVILIACVMALGAGVGFSKECPSMKQEEKGLFADGMPGPLAKLHRGVCNLAFCWLEIPKEIQAKSVQPERPYFVQTLNSRTISTVDAMVAGTLLGTCKTLTRAAGGVSEGVLFLIPPYRPIMDPPVPFPVGMMESTREMYVECRGCGPFAPGMLPCQPGLGMAMRACCPKMGCGMCARMGMGKCMAMDKGMKQGGCPKMKMKKQMKRMPKMDKGEGCPMERQESSGAVCPKKCGE